jgi:uncharacterized membrane protein
LLGTLTRPPAQDEEGGLDDGAVAAIILGCLLLILIVMTVVLCILYQKGKYARLVYYCLNLVSVYHNYVTIKMLSCQGLENKDLNTNVTV